MDEIPVVFATPRWLRVLNVVAVASSLAACTSAVFMFMNPHSWTWALVAGVPTLITGAMWAAVLRWQKTTRGGLRWGWLASVPLAALNGALAGGAFLATGVGAFEPEIPPEHTINLGAFIGGALIGGTFGVIFWAPALVMVLVAFGIPIARAQRMAKLGLAGEERGEILVGALSAVLGALALALAYTVPLIDHVPRVWDEGAHAGRIVLHLMSLSSVIAGITAGCIALAREARRRSFVARVEACNVPGFRVAPTVLGKVLLRVAPVATYRVSDVGEELFELDDRGSVKHRLHGSSRSHNA